MDKDKVIKDLTKAISRHREEYEDEKNKLL